MYRESLHNTVLFTVDLAPMRFLVMNKDSYSRVNESKQQLNSFIIYDLDSIARVNDNPKW